MMIVFVEEFKDSKNPFENDWPLSEQLGPWYKKWALVEQDLFFYDKDIKNYPQDLVANNKLSRSGRFLVRSAQMSNSVL